MVMDELAILRRLAAAAETYFTAERDGQVKARAEMQRWVTVLGAHREEEAAAKAQQAEARLGKPLAAE